MMKSLAAKRFASIAVFVILQLIALALLRGGLDIMDEDKVMTALMWGTYLIQIHGCLMAVAGTLAQNEGGFLKHG